MMNRPQTIHRMILIVLLLTAGVVHAEVLVIVHPENEVEAPSAQQLSDIFLGRDRTTPDGHMVQPIDQSESTAAFHEFHYKVTGMSSSRLQAYWAKRIFTGRGQPPQRLDDDAAVLEMVTTDPTVIGYVSEKSEVAAGKVRILLRIP